MVCRPTYSNYVNDPVSRHSALEKDRSTALGKGPRTEQISQDEGRCFENAILYESVEVLIGVSTVSATP